MNDHVGSSDLTPENLAWADGRVTISLTKALRDLIARYEYDGIPNDSLPTVEAARCALAAPMPSLGYERIKQLWREASMAYNEDRGASPVHLFASAIEHELRGDARQGRRRDL